MGIGVLNFKNIKFNVKLTPDEPFTDFEFLTGFNADPEDNTSTLATSTRTLQVGDNSTGSTIKLDQAVLPRNKEHARLQHRICTQGKNGFYEAFFEGDANTDNLNADGTSSVHVRWLMRNGTFVPSDSYSPSDMLTGSANLKTGELIKEVDGYDGTGDYNQARTG